MYGSYDNLDTPLELRTRFAMFQYRPPGRARTPKSEIRVYSWLDFHEEVFNMFTKTKTGRVSKQGLAEIEKRICTALCRFPTSPKRRD